MKPLRDPHNLEQKRVWRYHSHRSYNPRTLTTHKKKKTGVCKGGFVSKRGDEASCATRGNLHPHSFMVSEASENNGRHFLVYVA